MILILLPVAMISGATVCIDPGHGGSSSGAVGEYMLEKDAVLEVALELVNWLGQVQGIEYVGLTRDGDYDVSLQARTDYANAWGFDYFVSIHENAHSLGLVITSRAVGGHCSNVCPMRAMAVWGVTAWCTGATSCSAELAVALGMSP